MVSVDKPYVDVFTRLEAAPEKPKERNDSEYGKYKKVELVKMLEDRDFEMAQRFKQEPSAIDRVTDLVAPVGEGVADQAALLGAQELAAIFRELINDEKIEMMTDLRPVQIRAFARAWWICNQYEYDYGKGFLISMLKFAVSKDRKGRLEFIKAIASAPPMMGGGGLEGEEEISAGRLREMLGRWG